MHCTPILCTSIRCKICQICKIEVWVSQPECPKSLQLKVSCLSNTYPNYPHPHGTLCFSLTYEYVMICNILFCRIRRKTLYYMYNIVFPCMMMSTLTVSRISKKLFQELWKYSSWYSLFGIFKVSLYSEKIYISEGSFILLSDIFQALVL